MPLLYHHPLCPFSRRIRLALGEINFQVEFIEELVWERRKEFLIMNPAGTIPVLVDEGSQPICGIMAISEFLEEIAALNDQRRLIPGGAHSRAEVRRLVEWFDVKFNAEVTQPIAHELIDRRFMNSSQGGGGGPNMEAVRVGRKDINYHLDYIGYLTGHRRWLAGDKLSYADLAAAAHLSCIDFIGDVPWERSAGAKDWYARIKSRPSFRPLLKDKMKGMTVPDHYENLDF